MAWMDALCARDSEAAMALSAPTFVYTNGKVRRYEGHRGIHDVIAELTRMEGFLTIDFLDEILEDGPMVAIRKIEKFTLPSGGIEIEGVSFVRVENGLVTRWWDYKSMVAMDQVVD